MAWRGVLALALLGPALVVLGADPASACSCMTGTPEAMLADADVAFIGEPIARSGPGSDGERFRFAVDQWLTEDPGSVEVELDGGPSSCGISVSAGQAVAVYATRDGDDLVAGPCSTLDAAVVRASLQPLGVQSDEPAVFVVRADESPHLYLLDDDGLIVGYAEREVDEITHLWDITRCPGDQRLVEQWGDGTVIVRDMATLEVVRETTDDGLAGVHCVEPTGADLVREVFADPDERRVRLLAADGAVLAEGAFTHAEVAGDAMLVASGGTESGEGDDVRVSRVDLTTGEVDEIVVLESGPEFSYQELIEDFVVSPDGTMAAFDSSRSMADGSEGSTELVVVDVATAAVVARTTAGSYARIVDWTPEGLVVANQTGADVLDPERFEPLATVDLDGGWFTHRAGDRLVAFDGPRLTSWPLEGGDPTVLNVLRASYPQIVGVLPVPVTVSTDAPSAPLADGSALQAQPATFETVPITGGFDDGWPVIAYAAMGAVSIAVLGLCGWALHSTQRRG